jgi:hypothetical protein
MPRLAVGLILNVVLTSFVPAAKSKAVADAAQPTVCSRAGDGKRRDADPQCDSEWLDTGTGTRTAWHRGEPDENRRSVTRKQWCR